MVPFVPKHDPRDLGQKHEPTTFIEFTRQIIEFYFQPLSTSLSDNNWHINTD
jgi:hypothetical protein